MSQLVCEASCVHFILLTYIAAQNSGLLCMTQPSIVDLYVHSVRRLERDIKCSDKEWSPIKDPFASNYSSYRQGGILCCWI